MLQKARQFSKEMGLGEGEFSRSNGWLHGFKKRHNIAYKKAHGEKASTDPVAAEKFLSGS